MKKNKEGNKIQRNYFEVNSNDGELTLIPFERVATVCLSSDRKTLEIYTEISQLTEDGYMVVSCDCGIHRSQYVEYKMWLTAH